MDLHLLTNNLFKIETARMALQPFGISVVPISLGVAEIQANTNIEIARVAAIEAAKILDKPIVREDHGFYLNAFSGWPGPYMAHTERILLPEDALRLLKGKNRSGYFELALAYAKPTGETIEFTSQVPASIAESIMPGSKDFGWDSIICLGEEKRTISQYPESERYSFFTQNYMNLAKILRAEKLK